MVTIASMQQKLSELMNTASGSRPGVWEIKELLTDMITYIDSLDEIGLDAGLASIAGLTTAADKGVYTSASDTYATYDLTAYGRSIGGVADEAAFKALVNLEIGTDVQAYHANLAALAAVTAAPPTQYIDVTLSSAQVLDLFDTPITVIAAPGANKITQLVGGVAVLDYNSTAYTLGSAGNFTLRYTNNSGNYVGGVVSTGFFDQTSDRIRLIEPYGALTPNLTGNNANAPIVAGIATADMTLGNSPLKLRLAYRVYDYSSLVA